MRCEYANTGLPERHVAMYVNAPHIPSVKLANIL